jgi:hypothetical protein
MGGEKCDALGGKAGEGLGGHFVSPMVCSGEAELSDAHRYTVRHKLAIYFCIWPRHTGEKLYIYRVPRGNPHKPIIVRLDRALEAEVRDLAGPRGFSAAVTEGLRWWVARQKRRQREADPLAEREITARKEPA